MTAKGFCTCERDFPGRYPVPWNATWHYLCDRPIHPDRWGHADEPAPVRETGTGWPPTAAQITDAIRRREHDDPPEDDPADAEAQRIAEEYADAAAELARIEAEEAHDRAGEQWQEAAYQPAPPDPYSGGVS